MNVIFAINEVFTRNTLRREEQLEERYTAPAAKTLRSLNCADILVGLLAVVWLSFGSRRTPYVDRPVLAALPPARIKGESGACETGSSNE